MNAIPLLCTVRGCGQRLERAERGWLCGRQHRFDQARAGYVNLLQPQDRRSRHPGDTAEAVAGRRRLHASGATRPFLEALVEEASRDPGPVLDAGCGDGFYLGLLAARTGRPASGLDLSVRAIEAAARRYPDCLWVVGNADRFLPYPDHTFTLALSITGRLAPASLWRVLDPAGLLVVGLAAPDDLIELRGQGRDRRSRTVATLAPYFHLCRARRVTVSAALDADTVRGLRHAIYRPLVRRDAPEPTRVTLSLDLMVFQPLPLPPLAAGATGR